VNNLPPVTIQIRIGQSYTRCDKCFSVNLTATPTGMMCNFCKEPITESKFINLMREALQRHRELEAGRPL
jgi:hypothetical protein